MSENQRETGNGKGETERPRHWRYLVSRASRFFRQVFGMPDYERYLDHRRTRHPGEPVLGPRAFYDQQIRRRYEGGMGRCC